MKKGIIISLFWGMGMAAGMAQSVYPGICEGRFSVSVQVPLAAESFDLQDVRLLPGRFRGQHDAGLGHGWSPSGPIGCCMVSGRPQGYLPDVRRIHDGEETRRMGVLGL